MSERAVFPTPSPPRLSPPRSSSSLYLIGGAAVIAGAGAASIAAVSLKKKKVSEVSAKEVGGTVHSICQPCIWGRFQGTEGVVRRKLKMDLRTILNRWSHTHFLDYNKSNSSLTKLFVILFQPVYPLLDPLDDLGFLSLVNVVPFAVLIVFLRQVGLMIQILNFQENRVFLPSWALW